MEEENNLQLQIGDTVQLQFVGDTAQRRYYTTVIGYLAPKSLLVTAPHKDGKFVLIREGQVLVGRTLSGNNVYGFTTSVLVSCTKPYPYLHLGYPKELEMIVVRKAYRAKANLIVSVQIESGEAEVGASLSAVIIDISTSGALLKSEGRLGGPGDLLSISARVKVGEVQEYLSLSAVIRSSREEFDPSGRLAHYLSGVEFQLLEQHDNVVLHGYVYEKLIRN